MRITTTSSAVAPRVVVGVLVALSLLLPAWSPAQTRPKKMDAQTALMTRLAALPDDAFARRDAAAIASLPDAALNVGLDGLVLGAARAPGAKAASNVLLLTSRSERRLVVLPWDHNATVVATDLDRGTVYAVDAIRRDESKAPERLPERPAPAALPPAPAPGSLEEAVGGNRSAGTMWLDYRNLLSLPAAPARYALRMIYFDQVSNPALVDLGVPAASSSAPPAIGVDAALALVERLRAAGQSPHKLPTFFRSAATPALQAPGVALALGSGNTRPLPVHGAIRIELTPQMMVARPAQAPAGSVRPPVAIIKAMVLVVTRNEPMPYRIALDIPVWSDHELRAGELVDAAFSVDLTETLTAQTLQGISQVYLLAGRYISGPHGLRPPVR